MSATTVSSRPTPVHSSNSLRQATLKKNMSITQTYYLAHRARGKLSREAAQPDHDLRLLVGHANLLDSLMIELADAEREQERWFNQSVRGASKTEERRVQWADRIVEETEEDFESDSDSSEDELEEDVEMVNAPVLAQSAQLEAEDDLEEDYAQLELVRTPSHSNSPPELVDHDSDSSDDESMPPSPPQPSFQLNEKEVDAEESEQEQERDPLYEKKYYMPARNPAGLVTAITVY